MPKKTGYIEAITKDSGANTFSGDVTDGGQVKSFSNQVITGFDGLPITDVNDIGLDSLIEYEDNTGPITDCTACITVSTTGPINRPNTAPQIKNLVNAIKMESGTGITVRINKG